MDSLKQLFQDADWKSEKHVPVISVKSRPSKGTLFQVTLSVGKEISHPNTTAHHISWIELYFLPEGEKIPCRVGRVEFAAHGASVQGPDTGSVYTHHEATFGMKTDKPGTLFAAAYCNIHGLWESAAPITF